MAIDCDAYGFFNKVLPMNQTNWANHFRGVLSDCVVAGIGEECLVYTGTEGIGMKVRVLTGQAMVNNHRAFINSAKELDVSESDAEFDRIDTVVLRVIYGDVVGDVGTSKIELDILEGEPAGIPDPAALTQVTGGTYEMPLAYIRVQAGTETVLPDDVTDARYIFDGSDRIGIDFINGEEDALEVGELVKLTNMDFMVKRADEKANNTIGVVTAGAPSMGHVKVQCEQGKLVDIKCSYDRVIAGDGLIVDTANPGMAKRGGGQGVIGLAVQGKSADIIANVKSLLMAYSYFPTQSTWYLPTGTTDADIIAVYQFVSQKDESAALKPIAGNSSYNLTKSSSAITWRNSDGFYFPAASYAGLRCNNLSNQSIATVVVRYSDINTQDPGNTGLVFFPSGDGGSIKGIVVGLNKINYGSGYDAYVDKHIGYVSGNMADDGVYKMTSALQKEGVLALQVTNSKFFIDGVLTSTTAVTGHKVFDIFAPTWHHLNVIGQAVGGTYEGKSPSNTIGKSRIQAVAFYSTALTDAQIAEVSGNMAAL